MKLLLDQGTLLIEYTNVISDIICFGVPFCPPDFGGDSGDESDPDVFTWAARIDDERLGLSRHELQFDRGVLAAVDVIGTRPEERRSADAIAACELLYSMVVEALDETPQGETIATLEQVVREHYRLVIVPTGAMARIPWHALRNERRWLWESHLINVIPSIAFSCANGIENSSRLVPIESVLIMGDPHANLKHSRLECSAVAEHCRSGGVRHRLLVGKQLTLDVVREHYMKYEVLHFACHARQMSGDPSSSYVSLFESQASASEIASWDLGGKVVVLSCCETAKGELTPTDEGFSLAHACLIAGARYVVASLWAVDDSATADLMVNFYRFLMAGQTPQFALNWAIREYLHSPTGKSDPYYWAPFQVFGNPTGRDARTLGAVVEAVRQSSQAHVTLVLDPLSDEREFMRSRVPAGWLKRTRQRKAPLAKTPWWRRWFRA